MKKLYTVLCVSLLSTITLSQSCLPEGITFYSQQEIDDFAADYPGCTEIEGFVRVNESTPGNILNLNGLSQLILIGGELNIARNDSLSSLEGIENITSVGGRLTIGDNPALTSLMGCRNVNSVGGGIAVYVNNLLTDFTGLDSVASIGGFLRIYDNNSLENLTGLERVTSIGEDLKIYNSPALTSLSGLDNVVTVGSDLVVSANDALTNFSGLENLSSTVEGCYISENVSLTSFTGLENLDSIGGDFSLYENPVLINIAGLNSLVFVGGRLRFTENTALASLAGLENLSSIGGRLNIYENAALTSLAALSNVTSLGGDIVIGENHALTNLVGLENITSIGGTGFLVIVISDGLTSLTGIQNIDASSIQFLRILNNPNLPDCEVQSVCEYLGFGGPSEVGNNKAGCNTEQQILNACSEPPACTNLIMPGDGSSNVNVTTDLSWTPVAIATGYRLTMGTTAGGVDILDNFDVGNVTTYDPGDLPCGEEIFVTIVPFNWMADASDCVEESFTTEDVTPDAGNDIAMCLGGSTQLQASGGSVYSWSPVTGLDDPGIANPIASPDTTTTYTVTVSKDGRCPTSEDVTVTINPLPAPNASATDETGKDLEDGTATSMPSGGTPAYSYAWSNGDTTQTIIGLVPGDYTVTVSDANMCAADETVTVVEAICPVLAIFDTLTDASCFDLCDGVISISGVENGVAPFLYAWSNGQSSQTIDNLCEGDYSITVTDNLNCTVIKSYSITEPTEVIPNASATNETGNEFNDGTASCSPTGGTGDYSYSWSNGETTQSIGGLAPGQYIVLVTDANGCVSNDTAIVEAFICPVLETNAQTANTSCYGVCDGVIEILNVNNGSPPFTYSWSSGESTASLSSLCANEYVVTITDASNCTVSDTFAITQPGEIVIAVDSTRGVGSDFLGYIAVSTNNTGNYIFTWSGPAGFSAITEAIDSLSEFGCYTLTVIDTLTNCSVDSTICLDDLTALPNVEEISNRINLYPNPTSGEFILDFRSIRLQSARISLIDGSGRVRDEVYKAAIDDHIEFKTGHLNSGLYFVQIKSEEFGVFYKKVIVSR